MSLATKFSEIEPVSMKDFVQRAAHSKFKLFEVQQKENELFETVEYNLTFYTTFDFAKRILENCSKPINKIPNLMTYLKERVNLSLKKCLYNLELVANNCFVLSLCNIIYHYREFCDILKQQVGVQKVEEL